MGGWEGEGRKEGERNSFSRRCTSDNNATLNFPFYKVKMPLPLNNPQAGGNNMATSLS